MLAYITTKIRTTKISKFPLLLTIDTGAHLSLIKTQKLDPKIKINVKKAVKFRGISASQIMKTLGSIRTTIYLNNVPFEHEFNLVNRPINLTSDGVIGLDFLQFYAAAISFDYDQMTLFTFCRSEERETDGQEKDRNPNSIETHENESLKQNLLLPKSSQNNDVVHTKTQSNFTPALRQENENIPLATDYVYDYYTTKRNMNNKNNYGKILMQSTETQALDPIINENELPKMQPIHSPCVLLNKENNDCLNETNEVSFIRDTKTTNNLLFNNNKVVNDSSAVSMSECLIEHNHRKKKKGMKENKSRIERVKLISKFKNKTKNGNKDILNKLNENGILSSLFNENDMSEISTKNNFESVNNCENEILYEINSVADDYLCSDVNQNFPIENVEKRNLNDVNEIINNNYINTQEMNESNERFDGVIRDEQKENLIDPEILEFKGWDKEGEDDTPITDPQKRNEYIMKNVDLSHCTEEEKNLLAPLFLKYHDVFKLPSDPFKRADVKEHDIRLKPGSDIVNIRQYRLPESHIRAVDKHIETLIKNDIIEPSDSPYNSPILIVPKRCAKTGLMIDTRMVIDFRALNEVTEVIRAVLLRLDQIVDKAGGCKKFITLDLDSAFLQVPLSINSRPYTAFSTSWTKWQFKSMPYGLKNSPSAFNYAISRVLEGLIGKDGLYVYMDDIGIMHSTSEAAVEALEKVLQRLSKYGLKINLKKSKFLAPWVKFLGYILSEKGLEVDPSKSTAIANIERPINLKGVRGLMGFLNYNRRFIKDMATKSLPILHLLKKNVEFVWSEKCEQSFQVLKESLIKATALAFPDFSKPFRLHVDASGYAVGGYLSQLDENGHDRPIHFFSKTLNPAQRNYSALDREMLSIVYNVQYFSPYLIGHHFLLYTDAQILVYLFNCTKKNTNSRLLRWLFHLQSYDFKIVYKTGKTNVVADFLSRLNEGKTENAIEFISEEEADKMHLFKSKAKKKVNNIEISSEGTGVELSTVEPAIRVITRAQQAKINESQKSQNHEEQENGNSNVEKENNSLGNKDNDDEIVNLFNDERIDNYLIRGNIDENLFDSYDLQNDDFVEIENENLLEKIVEKDFYEELFEKNGILIAPKVHEHLFFFIESNECDLFRKMQLKLKMDIVIDKLKKENNILRLDVNRSIVIVTNLILNEQHKHEVETAVQNLKLFCQRNEFTNVAICVDFYDALSYFNFKQIISKCMLQSKIKITLFLDCVIEVLDEETKQRILYTHHNSILGGHAGYARMHPRIAQSYHWDNMTKEIKEYIAQCSDCESGKITRHTTDEMFITQNALAPFVKVYYDLIGPIATSQNGYSYIFTCIDDFSKYLILSPLVGCTAYECANVFVHKLILLYGFCDEICTDNATYFTAKLLKEITRILNIKHYKTCPYNPRANLSERANKEVKRYLTLYVQENPENWCEFLDYCAFSYNTTANKSTGFTPYELVFGKPCIWPQEISNSKNLSYPPTYKSYALDVKRRMKHIHELAKNSLNEQKLLRKKYFDKNFNPNPLKVQKNSLVLHRVMVKPKFKFSFPYHKTPFRVYKVLNSRAVIIKKGKRFVKVSTWQLKPARADYKNKTPALLD